MFDVSSATESGDKGGGTTMSVVVTTSSDLLFLLLLVAAAECHDLVDKRKQTRAAVESIILNDFYLDESFVIPKQHLRVRERE
jgi:hypothetical protein